MASTITYQLRRDKLENWERVNPLLKAGEPVIVFMPNGSVRFKAGDGIHNFRDLPYVPPEEVQLVHEITAADVANKYIELNEDFDANQAVSVVLQNVAQIEGADWTIQENDYPTPDKLTWDGLGLEELIQAGDILTVTYHKK